MPRLFLHLLVLLPFGEVALGVEMEDQSVREVEAVSLVGLCHFVDTLLGVGVAHVGAHLRRNERRGDAALLHGDARQFAAGAVEHHLRSVAEQYGVVVLCILAFHFDILDHFGREVLADECLRPGGQFAEIDLVPCSAGGEYCAEACDEKQQFFHSS